MSLRPDTAEVEVFADDARENVVVRILRGRRSYGIDLDGATAEQMALLIAKHRATLTDPVPASLDFNARLSISPDPSWMVSRTDDKLRRALLLRHPGLGWLTFSFSDDDAAKLSSALVCDNFERA